MEITSKLELLDVWIRKQLQINNDLLHKAENMQEGAAIPMEQGQRSVALLGGATAVASLIGTTADIIGYLKTDYAFKSREFSLKEEALNSAVAGKLKTGKSSVFIYNFYSLAESASESNLIRSFTEIYNLLLVFMESRNRLDYYSKINSENSLSEQLKDAVSESDEIYKQSNAILTKIISGDDSGAESKLTKALLREKIVSMKTTHILCLKVISSGGEAITKKKSLGITTNISYIGGTVISYILAGINGEVLSSGTMPALSAFDFDPSGKMKMPLREMKLTSK